MRVKLALLALIILLGSLFIASCTSGSENQAQQQAQPYAPVIYVVEEQDEQPKVFVVEEKAPLGWYEETKEQRNELNIIRNIKEDEDEQKEFELESKLSNVRRNIDDKLIIGYDEEIDNTRWKEVDK